MTDRPETLRDVERLPRIQTVPEALEVFEPMWAAAQAQRKQECEDRGVHVFAKGHVACPHCNTSYAEIRGSGETVGHRVTRGGHE